MSEQKQTEDANRVQKHFELLANLAKAKRAKDLNVFAAAMRAQGARQNRR